MKIIGRILIISAVFYIFAGLIVTAVNASGTNARDFGGASQFRPENNGAGFGPGNDGNRPERGDGPGGGAGWLFGVIKNVFVIAVLVTVIVWPRGLAKKKKRTVHASTANDKL